MDDSNNFTHPNDDDFAMGELNHDSIAFINITRPTLLDRVMRYCICHQNYNSEPRINLDDTALSRLGNIKYGNYLNKCLNACRDEFDKGYDDLGMVAERTYARCLELEREYEGIIEGELAQPALSAMAWLVALYSTPNATRFSLALRQEAELWSDRVGMSLSPKLTEKARKLIADFALEDSDAFTLLLFDPNSAWDLKPARIVRKGDSGSAATQPAGSTARKPAAGRPDSEEMIAMAVKAVKGLIPRNSRKHKWAHAFKAMVELGIIPDDYPHKDFAERVERHAGVKAGTVLGSNQGWTFSSSDEKRYESYFNDIKRAIEEAMNN